LNKCDPLLAEGAVFGTSPEAGAPVANASAVILIPNKCD
jgi:hypothetical protein